jgi:8-oxo-dGTP pyrophosphatase MutT (NUDIX family)
MDDAKVIPVERFELRFVPRPWAFADANRAAIDAHFAAKQRANPALWNGRVLLAYEHGVANGVCRGAFLETDFANFDAWRDWGCPPAAVMDCFAVAALQASDGAYLLGIMAAHTANAGQVYFPCGTPDPDDIVDGRVDLEHSARRELTEETGLNFEDLQAEPGWLCVLTGPCAMHAKLVRARQPAEELRRRILGHLASERQPELADIRIVRGPADLDPMMPPFIVAFLRHMWK